MGMDIPDEIIFSGEITGDKDIRTPVKVGAHQSFVLITTCDESLAIDLAYKKLFRRSVYNEGPVDDLYN
jgi:hypothetical protein